MYLTTLRSVGGSVMFAVPKAILEGLGLSSNSRVGLSVTDGRIIVEPHPRTRHTLAELLAQCDPSAPPSDEDREWLDEPPVGRETF
jgi:antitoxin ChpS